MQLTRNCPICHKKAAIFFDEKESVKTAFEGLNAVEYDFVKYGRCPACQQIMNGRHMTNRIINIA